MADSLHLCSAFHLKSNMLESRAKPTESVPPSKYLQALHYMFTHFNVCGIHIGYMKLYEICISQVLHDVI